MLMVKDHVLLPVLMSMGEHDFIKIAKKTYEKMGIVVSKKHDGIMEWCKLPEGWWICESGDGYDLLVERDIVMGEIHYERNVEGYLTYAIFKEVK